MEGAKTSNSVLSPFVSDDALVTTPTLPCLSYVSMEHPTILTGTRQSTTYERERIEDQW